MPQNSNAKLAALKKKVAALESQLTRANRQLLALPAKFGFKSMDAFIAALKAAARSSATPAPAAAAPQRRKRAKITPEMKAKVKALVGEKKTGGAIAKALGISLPSVQNIKKELGLVQKRGK